MAKYFKANNERVDSTTKSDATFEKELIVIFDYSQEYFLEFIEKKVAYLNKSSYVL